MKNFILVLAAAIALSGCGISTYASKSYEVGKQKEATVGSIMVSWEVSQGGSANTATGFRKELSYSGIAQNVVQVSYREFYIESSVAIAKPAFAQDLKYDLSLTKTITFRDMKISVMSADAEKIVFAVTKGADEVENAQVQKKKKKTGKTKSSEFDSGDWEDE